MALSRCLATLAAVFALATLVAAGELREQEQALKRAIEKKDLNELDRVIQQLRAAGGEEAVKVLVGIAKRIPPGENLLYWHVLNGAAGMQDEAALRELADTILASSTGHAVSRDLMFAMQNNRAPRTPTVVHARILEKGADDLQLMAADQLALIETSDSVDVLIQAFKREEKKDGELRRRILNGLKSLTGADCGVANAWEQWWAGARADGPQGRQKREQQAATGTVVDQPGRGSESEVLAKLKPELILVLAAGPSRRPACEQACNYDRIERVLEAMQIPHEVRTVEDFNAGKVPLEGRMALILNCVQINDHCICPTCVPSGSSTSNRLLQCSGCDKHDNVNHRLSGLTFKTDPSTGKQRQDPISGSIKRIKEWVERGGYLFSEDYGLNEMLEPAWPGFVKVGKSVKQRTVICSPARGRTTHPMLRGVFVDPAARAENEPGAEGETAMRDPNQLPANALITREWVIDDDSPLIDVTGGQNVVLLMTSEDLKKEGGPAADAVALTFLPSAPQTEKFAGEGHPEKLGGGRVVHVLSHFGKQNSQVDEFALQNLLLNFVLEAHRRFPRGVK